ncbi:MAG: hypothetical protein AAF577_07160 [Pseudomonadota bacterium]
MDDGRRAVIARHAAAPWRLLIGDLISFVVFGAVAGVAMGISVLALAGLTGLSPIAAARIDALSQIHGGVGLLAILGCAALCGRRYGVGPGQALLGLRGFDEEGGRVDVRYLFVRLLANIMLGGVLGITGPIMVGILTPGATGTVVLIALSALLCIWGLALRTDRTGRTAGHAAASMVVIASSDAAAYRDDLAAAGYLDVSPYWARAAASRAG